MSVLVPTAWSAATRNESLRLRSGQAPAPSWIASTSVSRFLAWKPARKPDEKLSDDKLGEPSALLSRRTGTSQARVDAARERQRSGDGSGMQANAGALGLHALARPRCASTARWTRSVLGSSTGGGTRCGRPCSSST